MSKETMHTEQQKKLAESRKSSAIMHAIEIASNFQLYSYRIISPEQFVTRTEELIRFYKESTQSKTDPKQLDLVDEIHLNSQS